MADVLLTGATGLLGSRVVRSLAAEHRVWAIGRNPPDPPAGVRWIAHDLRRPALPVDLPSRVDVVVHLAQAREFRDFPQRALDVYAVNVGSTALLLDFAVRAGARRFVLASTGSVYANGSDPHGEDEPTDVAACPSFYVASKLAGEALAAGYRPRFTVCVLRPFFMYGHGQDPSMLLPRLVRNIQEGRSIFLDGPEGMRFNPVHVSDAARAVMAALDLADSAVVNIAGPEVLSLRQAVDELSAQLGIPAEVTMRPEVRPADLIGDITRMSTLLARPRLTLRDAAADLCR